MPICDVSYHRTPCEILREINDHAQSILPNDKRIRELVCELEIILKKLLPNVEDSDFGENEDISTDLTIMTSPRYRYEGARNLNIQEQGLDEDGNRKVRITRC